MTDQSLNHPLVVLETMECSAIPTKEVSPDTRYGRAISQPTQLLEEITFECDWETTADNSKEIPNDDSRCDLLKGAFDDYAAGNQQVIPTIVALSAELHSHRLSNWTKSQAFADRVASETIPETFLALHRELLKRTKRISYETVVPYLFRTLRSITSSQSEDSD